MNKLAILALLGCCFTAHAEIVAVGIHTVSVHQTPREQGEWNNNNPGLYVRTTDGYVFGTLRNSNADQSFYAAKVWESPRWNSLAVDVTAGAITGYTKAVMPLLSFGVSSQVDNVTVRLGYLPKPPKSGSAALHLSFEWSLQ